MVSICIMCPDDRIADRTVQVFNMFTVPVCNKHYDEVRVGVIDLLGGMDMLKSPVDWEQVTDEVDSWLWSD